MDGVSRRLPLHAQARRLRAPLRSMSFAAACLAVAPAMAQSTTPAPDGAGTDGSTALARAAQNPVAAMISVPFQNNTNFRVGPFGQTQNVLNIQPVIPVSLTPEWNLITRTVIPLVSQPSAQAGGDTTFGLGPIQMTGFLSPARPGAVIWGLGAVVQAPTVTDTALGSNIWGGGPSAVALTVQGPWVIGALANNIWSFGGDDPRRRYNTLTLQPFVNYNFPESPGTYLSFSPVITANWEARSGQQWTVPLGLAVGQIFRVGGQALNGQVGAYYNVVRPDGGPEWQLRFQLALLFPT